MNEVDSYQCLSDMPQVPKTPSTPLLQVEGLNAWYGAAHILHGVSLHVGRGEVVALMGRNGAGKSTTLKSMVGLVERRQGKVLFMGADIGRKASHQIARLGLGVLALGLLEPAALAQKLLLLRLERLDALLRVFEVVAGLLPR